MLNDGLDEIAQEFLIESYENLNDLDRALVDLEKDPTSRELLASIFRTIHTIKGTSGFLAFTRLEAVTHVGENVLSRLRDGHMTLTPQITTVLLQMVDTIRALLASIETTGAEGDLDTSEVEAALSACLAPQAPATSEDVSGTAPTKSARKRSPRRKPAADAAPSPSPEAAAAPGEQGASIEAPPVSAAPSAPGPTQPGPVAAVVVDQGPAASPALDSVLPPEADSDDAQRRSVADSAIRVDVALLDQLMRMVGELVLTRNQVVQYVGDIEHPELQRASQRLDLIATELQEGVMKTRMQPIDQVFSRMPRLVRDLATGFGKQVRLTMEGNETELDRTLLEAVRDPLTHLIRNAVDHGLEMPQDRTAAGKHAEGTLSLRAFHEGGQVVVEVSDDGAGIDPVKIGTKAVERGLITREQLASMRPRQVLDLIFRPGFSTAAAVTNVSGRGVGMDVVRTNIERIGGTVDICSSPGHGTTIRVRIPLTLAIIPALIISQAGTIYAIPQVNLVELVRLEGESLASGLEYVAGAPVYRLRGRLLPLVSLAEQLQTAPAVEIDSLNIVVLSTDSLTFGLVVEEIRDTQEIVVRPLSRQIKHLEQYAGATITGDGKVALILDAAGLAARAAATKTAAVSSLNDEDEVTTDAADLARLLVCEVGAGRRLGLPMNDVARLEEIPLSSVERASHSDVVQYRGELLRLVHVASLLGETGGERAGDTYSVVVHRADGQPAVGLVVDRILDVVEQQLVLTPIGDDAVVAGSAVVDGCVTDILDVAQVVAATGRH